MFRPLSGTMNEHVLDLPVRLCGCWNTWCFRGISLKTVNMALQCTCHISVEHAQTLNRELEILPQTQAADLTTRQQQIRIVSGPSSSTFVCFSCCASYLPRAYLFAFFKDIWELFDKNPIPFGALWIDAVAMATLDAAGGLSADSPRCAARCTVANSGQSGRMRLGPVVNVDDCLCLNIGPCGYGF